MKKLGKAFKLFLIMQFIIFGIASLSAQENINITSPNGGEVWNSGSVHQIRWETNAQNGFVQIEYSTNNGLEWMTITSSTDNDGVYDWMIPENISSECLIRINQVSLQQCETRGTWVWASDIETYTKRNEVFQKLNDAKLNTIFIMIPSFNNNWGYGSQYIFLNFIMEAKNKGYSVHAWFPINRRLWASGITYLEYRDVIEQEAQSQWVQDILSAYGSYLNGIHLDMIRYLEWDEVNNEGKMDGVTATVKKIHDDLKLNYPNMTLSAAVFTLTSSRFDRKDSGELWFSQVPVWYRNWCDNNPGTTYTNDNYYYEGPHHMKVQQDPIGWLRDGIIDAIMPMHYAMDDTYWNSEINFWNSFNRFVGNDIKTVTIGLAWKRNKYNAPGVVRKIKYARSQGLNGFALFKLFNEDIDNIEDKALIDALTIDSLENDNNAPFKDAVPSCLESSSAKGTELDTSDSVFTITENDNSSNNLAILSPNGGEELVSGSTYNIKWESNEFSGNVKLEISVDSGNTWISIINSTRNDGDFSWTVSDLNSSTCLLKITLLEDSTGTDNSNAYFSIKTEITPILPGQLKNFSVLAINSMFFRTAVKVFSGNIGVLNKSSVPLIEDREISIADNVYLHNGVSLYGNRIKINSRSSVDNVFCNYLNNYGTIRGKVTKPLKLPMNVKLPNFPGTKSNRDDIKISDEQTKSLSSGTYGNIDLGKNSKLILNGGIYYIKNIAIGDYSQILFSSPTKLIIENRLGTGINPILGPEPGANISAKNIIIYVKGKNGSNGEITAEPKAVTIGIRHSLKANIFAPNGTIWFKARGFSEGAFIGKDIEVDFYVEFILKSAF